jgi:hypothetical protein
VVNRFLPSVHAMLIVTRSFFFAFSHVLTVEDVIVIAIWPAVVRCAAGRP